MSEAETAVESVTAAPEPRPGRTLAEARERRNQTVAEVAQQLKLSATQIEALEADDYTRLPGPVFVRGFVRNYARLMELDGEALVAALALPQDQSPAGAVPHSHNIPFPDGRGPRWPIYAVAIAVLAAIVVLFEFIFSAPPATVVTTVPPRQEVLLPRETSPAVQQPGTVAEGAQAPEAVVSAPVATEPLAAADAAPSASAKRSGLAELQFAFDSQSWVEVRDRDDRIVFSQLNPAGAVQHVQGRPPLNVVIGNASGVRVNYNGRPVDLAPHTRVEVARFTLE
jgi:cytoskeleton protein RodZ